MLFFECKAKSFSSASPLSFVGRNLAVTGKEVPSQLCWHWDEDAFEKGGGVLRWNGIVQELWESEAQGWGATQVTVVSFDSLP